MQRLVLRLLLLLLLASIGCNTLLGQEEFTSYTIAYWASPVSDATPDIAADFLSEIQDNLADYDVTVDVVRWYQESDQTDDATAFMNFTERFNGERVIVGTDIFVRTYANNVQHISPILEDDQVISFHLPNEHAAKLITGLMLYTSGKIDEAKILLQSIRHIDLDNGNVEFYLGNIELLNGNLEEAIPYFENQIWSETGRFYGVNLAWAYFQTGKVDEAFAMLREATDNERAFGNTYTETYLLSIRAQLYALAFDYDGAIADMDAAIELAEANNVSDEQLAELYTLRGEIIFLIYEWDRVLENFNTALELNPDYAPAYFQRGVLYYTMTERESALADFQHYLEIAPDGEHAAESQRYIDSIQLELESLGG